MAARGMVCMLPRPPAWKGAAREQEGGGRKQAQEAGGRGSESEHRQPIFRDEDRRMAHRHARGLGRGASGWPRRAQGNSSGGGSRCRCRRLRCL